MTKPLIALLTLAALSAATAATAEPRPVDERRPLKADASVTVSNVAGEIDVQSWDKNELHLTGELAAEVEQLKITGSESSLRIEVKTPSSSKHLGDTRLVLKVPAGASLDADAVSADIRVRGLRGRVVAKSVSGDIRLDVASKRVEAHSVSGDIELTAPAEDTRVESVSGDVNVSGGKGEIRGESVSGTLKVQARDVKRLDLETVSGDLELDVALAKDADVEVETLSGEITLRVPELPDVDVELQTFSGTLESDVLQGLRGQKEYGHEGKGKGRVRLHSFSGDITVRKR